MLKVLSLGAGVQSTTLLLMSCLGELPLLDAAVFADTQWEPAAVYKHLEWLTAYAAKAGIPVHKSTRGNLRKTLLEGQTTGGKKIGKSRFASIPLYVKNPDGTQGLTRRQCTSEYKIYVLEQFTRRHILGLKCGQIAPNRVVETWIGYSADEMRRVSKHKNPARFQVLRYPLVFDVEVWSAGRLFVHGMTRADCLTWLDRNGFKHPPRSACIGCPYHSDAEWLVIKAVPEEWADAVDFDRRIRRCSGMQGDFYVHRSMVPLDEVVFDVKKNWDGVRDNECLGMCGA